MSGSLGTAGAFAPPIPHPEGSLQTAPIGLNSGITSGNTEGNPLPMHGQDSAVRGVKDLARDAGAVTPMPVDPVPDIADKAKSAVTTTPDALNEGRFPEEYKANREKYQKENPSDPGALGRAMMKGDAKPGSVRDLARRAGAR
jgi:hypothetical protein